MKRVGIVGARGYTGRELIRILLKHPAVRLTYLAATLDDPQPISRIFPEFVGQTDLACEKFTLTRAVKQCDLVFLALPHTVSLSVVPKLMARRLKVIDLSADYRIRNCGTYERWYHKAHTDLLNLKRSVYGLPELYRERIKKAVLVANPGCYPTAAILGCAPVLAAGCVDPKDIVIDAKSGVSGAGKKATLDYSLAELEGNFKGYKFAAHQHAPEIDQELTKLAASKVGVVFCPHLLPVSRGIFETIYLRMTKNMSLEKVHDLYRKFYKGETFVRVKPLGESPELKHVNQTNYCDIGLAMDASRRLLIVASAEDNLIKGASGQAVQNMNLMIGSPETTALL
jgi:N-acetyl-gamma-glutamyl-phosphate reductase